MDPATLAVLSLGGTLLSAGVGVAGAAQQASAQAQAAKYQQQVYLNNQTIAQQNAAQATAAGNVQAENRGMQTRAAIGQEEAAVGASGIDLTTGSPKAVQESTRQVGRLSQLTDISNANLEAYGYRAAASSAGGQAQLSAAQARNATTAGGINIGSSLIGGASQFASKWSNYQLLSGQSPIEGVFG